MDSESDHPRYQPALPMSGAGELKELVLTAKTRRWRRTALEIVGWRLQLGVQPGLRGSQGQFLEESRLHFILVTIAAAQSYAGRDEDAPSCAIPAVAAKPDFGMAHARVAAAAANLGDMATARAALLEFRRLQPDGTLATFRAED